jgi:hypothetical protein
MQRSLMSRAIPVWLVAGIAWLGVSACAPLLRSDAVPAEKEERATVLGMADIRYWADGDAADLAQDTLEAVARERDYLAAAGSKVPLPPADFLAISGGGEP